MDSLSDDQREFTLALPPGTRLTGGYELLRPLGGSSAALTYLAREERGGAEVVVKEFLPRALAGRRPDGKVRPHSQLEEREYTRALRRFALESELLRDIVHEHLVRVMDVVEENGTAYVVMQQHEGSSLETMAAAAGGALPVSQAVDLMLCVLDALDVVHAEGIMHRAISPEAIVVSSSGAPRLLGFSASRHVPGSRDLGTPWMAIEQYGARGVGPWTDVHGCAAVLYRLITGSAPPSATERAAGTPLVAPAVAVRGLSPLLSILLLNALSQSTEQRPHGAAEFRRRLVAATRTAPWPQIASTAADASPAAVPLANFGASSPDAASGGGTESPTARGVGEGRREALVAVDSDDAWLVVPSEGGRSFNVVAPFRRAGASIVSALVSRLRRARRIAMAKARPPMLWILLASALTIALVAAFPFWRGRLRAEGIPFGSGATTTGPPSSARTAAAPPRVPAAPAPSASASVALDATLALSEQGLASGGPVTTADVPAPRSLEPPVRESRARETPALAPAAKPVAPPVTPKVKIGPIAIPTDDVELRSAPPAVLLALRDRFDAGAKQVDDGEYAAGHRIFQAVLANTDSVLQAYVASPGLRSLRNDVEQADTRARAACDAENALLRRRGAPAKPCA